LLWLLFRSFTVVVVVATASAAVVVVVIVEVEDVSVRQVRDARVVQAADHRIECSPGNLADLHLKTTIKSLLLHSLKKTFIFLVPAFLSCSFFFHFFVH